ncbi:hypothetical protein [Sphingomicrobium aestuariivivum]|uniref:hypothetical protein n=1 Tax=Sphingomicrobium aestuariivivum TaxID=1582356 RepID=UPI001FD6F243|nr:hypothetical protein [Sphingomicrobium aestuariivivum]MCJ8190705.1 hypothetical protein [Sphingomicrobium aestuariivivum]
MVTKEGAVAACLFRRAAIRLFCISEAKGEAEARPADLARIYWLARARSYFHARIRRDVGTPAGLKPAEWDALLLLYAASLRDFSCSPAAIVDTLGRRAAEVELSLESLQDRGLAGVEHLPGRELNCLRWELTTRGRALVAGHIAIPANIL